MSYQIGKGISCWEPEEIAGMQNYFTVPGPSGIPILSEGGFGGGSDIKTTSQRPQAQIFPLFGMNNIYLEQIE